MVCYFKIKLIKIYLILLSTCFLASCGGGGSGGGSTLSSNYGNSTCTYSCSNTSNSNGSSFASGTSESYNSSTASTWASSAEFDEILGDEALSGVKSSQNIYEIMNVHKAYAYGFTGDGVTIHIQDSGFDADHHEFDDKTITLYQSNYTSDTSTSWHANAVASVALGDNNTNTTGSMMGVAKDADLYFSDYDTNKSGSDVAADWSDALDASPSTTAASNHSYGITADIHTVLAYQSNNSLSDAATIEAYMDAAGWSSTSGEVANWIASLKTFQANKGVIVWANGNHSDQGWDPDKSHFLSALPEIDSDLKGAWLTVSTVDIIGSVGNETYYNRYANCGATASYCLSVDSYGVTVAAHENANSGTVDYDASSSYYYTTTSGNSFGAPMVSGSVAILAEAFSTLTPKEIAARLLATADNTWFTSDATTEFSNGVKHGFNFRFGHGIPDLYKALQPITSSMLSNSILVGDNINNSKAYNLSKSGLSLGSSFGDSLSVGLENEKGVFYDALYGTFNYDFSKSANKKNIQRNTSNFEEPKQFSEVSSKSIGNVKSNFVSSINVENNEKFLDPQNGFYYSVGVDDSNVIISNKMPLEYVLGFYELDNNTISRDKHAFKIPFIEDAENNYSFGTNIYNNGDTSVVLGYYNTDNNSYDKRGIVSSINFSNEDSKNSLILGYTEEEDRFLNSDAYGAFNINDKNNPTNFISKKYLKKLPSKSEILLSASYGFTNVNTNLDTLINKIGSIESSSFGINFTKMDILNNKDNLSFTISQPHRVEVGMANISIPIGRDKSGNLYYKNKDISLSPSGRQLDYSLDYIYNFSSNQSIKTKASISTDYNHIKDNDLQNSLSLLYNLSF